MSAVEAIVGGVPLASIPADLFETYEARMVPAVFEPWGRRLVDAAGITQGERVLDIACGTGIVARLAAARVGVSGEVTGLDALAGMLEVARAVGQPADPAIDWVEADAQALPLPDASFDVVMCQQGLQFFPDKLRALEEARRVLAPDGRLALSVWRGIDHSPAVAALQTALEVHAPEVAGFLPLAFSFANATDLHRLLAATGLTGLVVRAEVGGARFASVTDFLETYLGATPVGGVVAALPDESRAALYEEVTDRVRDYVDDAGLLVVQETHIATATSPM
jgi:SAM-dependent methyltransferase